MYAVGSFDTSQNIAKQTCVTQTRIGLTLSNSKDDTMLLRQFNFDIKCSAVAEMGDRLATIDGPKIVGAVSPFFEGGYVPI